MQRIRLESAAFERADDVMADQRRLLQAQQRQVLIWTMVAALIIAIGLAVFVAREIGLYAAALADRYEALSLESDRRARAEMQLRQAQKMEALGQLTGGVAHDFNNMLAVVIGNLDMLLRRLQGQDERLHALAENALKGANTAAALTKSLLAFSRLQPLTPRSTDVNACVAEMAEVLRRTLGEHIAVETALEDGLWPAFVDAPQLESALLNLAVNARDAMAAGGRLTIETANARLETDDGEAAEAGEYVMVAVSDSGAGMTPEVMEKAFDPFFTTKEVGAGTGLGLSQVHGFVKQSGGRIRLESELGRGTSVRLYLPRDRAGAPAPDPAGHRPAAADAGDALVLVVEDDPGVRAFVTSAVRELGYGVVEADTAAAALERLGEDPSIALLLTDVVMPQMTGRALADQARGRRPDLAVVFMTGYTRGAVVHDRAIEAGVRLLAKPFTVSDLARELNAAMAETRPLPSTAPT
jgi:signal transduction histidine kinase/ActR/RegA family two-component response regulator